MLSNIKDILTNKKVIIPLIVAIIVIEAVWAISVLYQPAQKPIPRSTTPLPVVEKKATLSLIASKTSPRVGEQVVVDVVVFSPQPTDGTDIIIGYDPNVLSFNKPGRSAVALDNLYDNYPVNSVDEKLGRIVVSGISSKVGGVVPKGRFGSVTFTAKKAGKTQIAFEFTPGATTDSNVVETKTAKDLLGQVTDVELNIIP